MAIEDLLFAVYTGMAVSSISFFIAMMLIISGGACRIEQWFVRREEEAQEAREERQQLEIEWAGVPATALSRAQPPGKPVPTETALSLAEKPEEKPLLASALDGVETHETLSVSA